MPSIPGTGTSAWVEVAGTRAEEYSADISAEDRKSSCYIESEEDKLFVVTFSNNGTDVLSVELIIDGAKQVRLQVLSKHLSHS